MQAKHQHTRHKDRHHFANQPHKRRLFRKKAGVKLREQHRCGRGNQHKAKTQTYHPAVKLFYPVKIPRAVIITDNRRHALGKTANGRRKKLHHALHDGKRPYMQITAVSLQAVIQYNADEALRGTHDKGRYSQRKNTCQDSPFQF